jgi:hypothetical protein
MRVQIESGVLELSLYGKASSSMRSNVFAKMPKVVLSHGDQRTIAHSLIRCDVIFQARRNLLQCSSTFDLSNRFFFYINNFCIEIHYVQNTLGRRVLDRH